MPPVERPIPFSGPMVRALLAGTKTQTRRVVNSKWSGRCPYGQAGDRLWVREAWTTHACFDHIPPRDLTTRSIRYQADGQIKTGKNRPGMFMPRWASRITLEVTGVRLERLQDISEADARAEGVDLQPRLAGYSKDGGCRWAPQCPVQAYLNLWESINGLGSWGANPWVWVVSFCRITT